MQANSLENIKWPGGGGVGASQTPPPPPLYPSQLIIIFTSWKLFYWFLNLHINTKVDVFPSFLFDMGVSWDGVTLTLLASAGMKKTFNKLSSLSYF